MDERCALSPLSALICYLSFNECFGNGRYAPRLPNNKQA